jgi:hypothetical protein
VFHASTSQIRESGKSITIPEPNSSDLLAELKLDGQAGEGFNLTTKDKVLDWPASEVGESSADFFVPRKG